MLMSTESLQELTIGTTEGAMNQVNKSTRKVLENFVVENQFLTVLSMRGMQITAKYLTGVLERFRQGYLENQAEIDRQEAEQRKELTDLEKKYFRKGGDDLDNMPLELLLKTKRRNKQQVQVGPIKKLAL